MQEKGGKTPSLSTLHAQKASSKNISGVTHREFCVKKSNHTIQRGSTFCRTNTSLKQCIWSDKLARSAKMNRFSYKILSFIITNYKASLSKDKHTKLCMEILVLRYGQHYS